MQGKTAKNKLFSSLTIQSQPPMKNSPEFLIKRLVVVIIKISKQTSDEFSESQTQNRKTGNLNWGLSTLSL